MGDDGATGVRSEAEIAAWLTARFAAILEVDPTELEPSEPLEALGLASSDVVFLSGHLSAFLGREVSATVAWDHPTIEELSAFLAAVLRGEADLPEDELALDLDLSLYDL